MSFAAISNASSLREKAPYYLANATLVLAGYAVGDITVTIARALL